MRNGPGHRLSDEELAQLRWAYQHLEHPSLAARLTSRLATPIEEGLNLLPKSWRKRLDKATESSRWRLADGRIQVLEYQAHNADGDDDDNAHLLFDWDSLEVENRGAGEHWRIAMPAGTLDQMVMQLAMLFDLRDGKTEFRYPVATRGRIKEYRFERTGEEITELPFGDYRTVRLQRTDDQRDQSWVWSAPELEYFPVRFVKQKQSGLKTEILLRRLEFNPVANEPEP